MLRKHPDGLTASEIGDKTGFDPDAVRKALQHMPDCYIDRWTASWKGNLGATWIAVEIPENCPKPEQKLLVTKD
jgi:hypothetical protein